MITKQDFEKVAYGATTPLLFSTYGPKMIAYKNYIQNAILDIASFDEMLDVKDSKPNQGLIEKLVKLANREWLLLSDVHSLYCVAMAVATIVDEYGWGSYYLTEDGLWQLADMIQKTK